jgi:hypothetical protein
MKSLSLIRLLAVLCAFGLAQWPTTAAACAACMGDVNSRIAPAINDAIFLMLGCIGFMLASITGFAFYLMKRSKAPLPPHADFASVTNLSGEVR